MREDRPRVTKLPHRPTDGYIDPARQTHGDGKQTAETKNFK